MSVRSGVAAKATFWGITDTTPSIQPLPVQAARRSLHQIPSITPQVTVKNKFTPQATVKINFTPQVTTRNLFVPSIPPAGICDSKKVGKAGPQTGGTYIFKSDNSLPLYGCTTCTKDKIQRAFLTAKPASQDDDTSTYFTIVEAIKGYVALQV